MILQIRQTLTREPGQESTARTELALGSAFLDIMPKLKGAPLSVLVALSLSAQPDGTIQVDADTLANHTGYSPQTIWRAIKTLEEIKVDGQPLVCRHNEGGQFTANTYDVIPGAKNGGPAVSQKLTTAVSQKLTTEAKIPRKTKSTPDLKSSYIYTTMSLEEDLTKAINDIIFGGAPLREEQAKDLASDLLGLLDDNPPSPRELLLFEQWYRDKMPTGFNLPRSARKLAGYLQEFRGEKARTSTATSMPGIYPGKTMQDVFPAIRRVDR